jgi:uncharacterized protein YkwD
MRRALILVLSGTLAVLAACDAGTTPTAGTPVVAASDAGVDQPLLDANGHPLLIPNTDPGVAFFESEVLRLVNDYRLVLGLQPLVPSTRLGDAARAHARHMIDHRFVSHITPEGLPPSARMALANMDWTLVAENVASTYSSPRDVFEAWMASPDHRANIESDKFTHAGVGYALDGAPTPDFPYLHYWAMAFLKR